MSQAGAVAGTDADVARALAIEAARDRLHAEQAQRIALLELASAVGASSAVGVRVVGALEPVRGVEAFARTVGGVEQPEVAALQSEGRAHRAEAEVLRRARIPNPTVSIFAQRDGFGEHVLGAGLAFPLYLPHPLGPTNSGLIAEAEGLARRSDTEAERTRRERHLVLARAIQNYEAAKAELALYDEGKLTQARQTLSDLAAAVQSGKMPVREAIVAQRPLVDLLRGALTARHHLCLASVELARASGFPLEGGSP
jgi:cobalt-zinc-cadmium efflux system outer membrane protein